MVRLCRWSAKQHHGCVAENYIQTVQDGSRLDSIEDPASEPILRFTQ